jgi:tetratricopeptide (TPR) repeat protein
MDHSTGEEYIYDPEVILESALKKFNSDELINIIYSLGGNRSKDINDAKARLEPILDNLIGDFRKVIELKPSFAEGYYWIAAISFIKGESVEAINSLKRAIEISQDDSKINYKLGNKYYRAMLHCSLGQIYFQENRTEEALNEFKIAIDQNPEYSHAHSFISRIYQMRGDIGAARTYRLNAFRYNPLFRMEPTYPDSRDKQAQERFSLANLNPSRQEEFLRQAIELDGEFILAYYYLGLMYSKSGEWQKAIDCMNKVIELDRSQEDPYWELGVIYGHIYNTYQNEKTTLDLSIQNFKKATELNPYVHEFYGSLALNYFFKGNFYKAVEILKKAKELRPLDPNVNFYMAMFLKKKLDSNIFVSKKKKIQIYGKDIFPLLQSALDFCTDSALRADIEFFYKFLKKQK